MTFCSFTIVFRYFQLEYRRVPFNLKSPFGYLIGTTLLWIAVTYLWLISIVYSIIGIAAYLHGTTITNDIKCVLKSIDRNAKTKTGHKETYQKFSEFIEFHAATQQLSGFSWNLFFVMWHEWFNLELFMRFLEFSWIFQKCINHSWRVYSCVVFQLYAMQCWSSKSK